jgi:hypothetical protein
MTIYSTTVDTAKVQKILENYGSTFERPVDLEKFAKEISACCVNITYGTTSPTFEVSFTNSN